MELSVIPRLTVLDPASTLFALGRNQANRFLIRLTVKLNEVIVESDLQRALESTAKLYPSFFVRLVTKNDRLYFEPIDDAPCVGRKLFVKNFQIARSPQGFETQVSYTSRQVFVEFSHMIGDARSGFEFLRTLISCYLYLRHPDGNILIARPTISTAQQDENYYAKYAQGLHVVHGTKGCFQIKSKLGATQITTYQFSVRKVKAHAH